MSRPGSKKLLTTSKALVKLQRRNLASLSTPSAAGLAHPHPLLLLASQQPAALSSPPSASAGAGASAASNGTHSVAPSSSAGAAASSKAAAAGSSAPQPTPSQLSFFDLATPPYHPASAAVAPTATAPASSSPAAISNGAPPSSTGSRHSSPPSATAGSLLPASIPSSVRPRRESSSSPRAPSNSPREPSSLAQRPPSPTQNLTLPVGSPAKLAQSSALELWAAETAPSAPPAHVRPERAQRLVFGTGAFGIPKAALPAAKGTTWAEPPPVAADVPNGQPTQVGEDAYFVRASGFVHALGIADGVGGWARRKDAPNANAGRFSSLLMSHISSEVARSTAAPSRLVFDWAASRGLDVPGQADADLDPVRIMQKGYERCLEQARREGLQGSATALLALLAEDQLRIANLGDCCLTLIRNGEIFFRTSEMQHSFNQPFQLGTNSRDSPSNDSQFYSIQVKTDDIVVLCTDGLTDNIFDEELLEEISSFQRPPPSNSASASGSSTGSRASSPTPSVAAPASPTAQAPSAASPSPPGHGRPPSPSAAASSSSPPPASPRRPTQYLPLSPQRISEALCSRAKARSEQGRIPTSTSAASPSPSSGAAPSSPALAGVDGAGARERAARDSPFGVRARKEGFAFQGGKGDDISVVIAVVGAASSSSSSASSVAGP